MDVSVMFARWRQYAPHLVVPWPTRVHNQYGMSIGSAVFVRLMIVTDRPTDRDTDSLYSLHGLIMAAL